MTRLTRSLPPILAVLLGLPAAGPAPAMAHDVDVTSVARVYLDEIGEGRYVLSILDRRVPPIADPAAVLPVGCAPLAREDAGVRVTAGFAFGCREPLAFDDALTLPWGLAGVVVLARWSDGTDASAWFAGDGRSIEVQLAHLGAGAGSPLRLASTYVVLGVEHILLGVDHLLFVLGLLLLVRGAWPLVKTVTAFTVAHSLTLAAAVLGLVPVDPGPVEAAIALSIVLLAREIVMGYRGRESLVHRKPWLVALAFGLLHGLGFAGALGEIGLRSADVPLALLSFNLGVEAGQLAFVALLLAVHGLLRLARRGAPAPLAPLLGYALGGLSTLWLVERLPAVWGP